MTVYDPYNSSPDTGRAQRRADRYRRRYNRYQNPMRGLAGGLFIIALIFAFSLHGSLGGVGFLPIFFAGLALLSLFGSISSLNRHAIYGGIQGFVWLLGLALCFWIGFWPWILLPVAATMILGSLINPIMSGLSGFGFTGAGQTQQASYQQPYAPQQQTDYPSYQQGYQATPPQQTYEEGNQQYPYNPAPKEQYEQPQVQYPERQQELPPMEQQ